MVTSQAHKTRGSGPIENAFRQDTDWHAATGSPIIAGERGGLGRAGRSNGLLSNRAQEKRTLSLVVQKFGGSSVATAQRIMAAARRALRAKQAGNQVIV